MILFYLLIAVMPLEQHWFWRQELLGSFTLIKALGVVCLLIALGRILSGYVTPQLLRSAPAWWYLAFVAIQGGSYFIHGDDMAVELSSYNKVASILSLFIVTLAFVDSPLRLRRTLLVAICAAGFASLYTIRGQQLSGGPGARPSGIFDDANYYALVMALWIPLTYLWAVARRPLWERMLCFGSLVAMLLGSAFAASRGSSLGLGCALLFLVWHSRHRLRNFAIVAALTVPLLLYSPSSLLQRFTNPSHGDREAEEARLTAWRAAQGMIQAHPLTGVGLGNFKPLMERYRDPDSNVVSIAHNTYLETAAELGIPALAVHLSIFVAAFVTLGRVRRRAQAAGLAHFHNIALGLQAGLVSYFVGAFFVSSWWQEMVWMPVFLAISLDRLSRQIPVANYERNGTSLVENLEPTAVVGQS